ncbi:universal stress protein [Streptomyces mesophilus]|uniref:universal stress protein n=1 Tax=Streptomyces mesophilus TaxID=1775132 RepID=UPI00332A3053
MRRSVIAGVDGSARGNAAADWAAREALRRGVVLRVVYAASQAEDRAEDFWPYRHVPMPERSVTELTARHPELEIESVRLSGPGAPSLPEFAGTAELLVVGTRGSGGFAGLALGSTALAVAQQASTPVVLVPSGLACGQQRPRPDKVSLGVDAREPDDAACDFAFDEAQQRGVRLHAIHAWALPSAAAPWMPYPPPSRDRAEWENHEVQLLADALRPWRDKYPAVPVLPDVVLHTPAQALVSASRWAELIVVGRRGNALGPAVDALVRHTKCPVAVVPS